MAAAASNDGTAHGLSTLDLAAEPSLNYGQAPLHSQSQSQSRSQAKSQANSLLGAGTEGGPSQGARTGSTLSDSAFSFPNLTDPGARPREEGSRDGAAGAAPEASPHSQEQREAQEAASHPQSVPAQQPAQQGLLTLLQSLARGLLGVATATGTVPPGTVPLLTWHTRSEQLLVLRPAPEDRVLVFDFQQAPTPSAFTPRATPGALPWQALGIPPNTSASVGTGTGTGTDADTERASLTAELLFLTLSCSAQRGVSSAQWRPHAPRILAVGCAGGVCLWDTAAAEPLPLTGASPLTTGGAPQPWSFAEFVHQIGARTRQLARAGATFLEAGSLSPLLGLVYPGSAPIVSSLAWSPCGRLLAGAVQGQTGIHIWEAATGRRTRVLKGLGQVSLLQWSPGGDCLAACREGQYLQIWECETWSCQEWKFPRQSLSSLAWSRGGRVCLAAFSTSPLLSSIYVSPSPSPSGPTLEVHVLPADLPALPTEELSGTPRGAPHSTGSGMGNGALGGVPGEGRGFTGVSLMEWDPTDSRLAVVYTGGSPLTQGLVALYATSTLPLFQASLVGCIRGPKRESSQGREPFAAGGDARNGARWGPAPLSLGFLPKYEEGALLSVAWSNGLCSTYPLLFQ